MKEHFSIISEIAEGRPIHMLRPGTFTGSSGSPTTFTAEDIAGIVARFKAGKRIKPPITEKHDFGRAIGRVMDAWADSGGNLFGQPRWNAAGRQFLADEVYDGFSIELDRDDDGWFMIGGSLTNYPAVDGLAPVSLSAPVIDRSDAPGGAPTQEIPMAEEIVMETPSPAPPPLPAVNDAVVNAQVQAYVTQLQKQYEDQQKIAFERAQAEFERKIGEMQARQAIESYAQHITTPTLSRQHALPGEATQYSAFLLSLNGDQRKSAQALFDQVLAAGLVSFEEIGNSREGEDQDAPEVAIAAYEAFVSGKVATGMARSNAIAAVPVDLKERYNAARAAQKKGGR